MTYYVGNPNKELLRDLKGCSGTIVKDDGKSYKSIGDCIVRYVQCVENFFERLLWLDD